MLTVWKLEGKVEGGDGALGWDQRQRRTPCSVSITEFRGMFTAVWFIKDKKTKNT